jgi:hypothetical protein
MGATALVAGSALVAAAAAVAAGPSDYNYRINAHDRAIARRIVTVKPDLPELTVPWKGGLVKPDESPDTNDCKGYPADNLTGLTVTGDAEAKYTAEVGLYVDARTGLLATHAMVETDWQRNHPRGKYLSCYGQAALKGAGKGVRLVSVAVVKLPAIGEHQIAMRAILRNPTAAHNIALDAFMFSRGRVETVIFTAGAVDSPADALVLSAIDFRIAAGMASRIPPNV